MLMLMWLAVSSKSFISDPDLEASASILETAIDQLTSSLVNRVKSNPRHKSAGLSASWQLPKDGFQEFSDY